MLTDYDAYKAFIIIKAHYSGKQSLQHAKRMKTMLSRKEYEEKHTGRAKFFRDVAKLHSSRRNLFFSLAVNCLHNKDFFIPDYDHDIYNHHMKVVSAIYKYFCDDMDNIAPSDFQCIDGNLPDIVKKVVGGHVQYETAFIVHQITGWMDDVEKTIEERYVWNDFRFRLEKYGCFLSIENFERFEKRFGEFLDENDTQAT